jgi:chromatin remodeling complex protein RSC6
VKTEARKKGKKEEDSDKMEVVKEEGKEVPESAEAKDDSGKKEEKEGEVKKDGEEGESEKKETDKKKEPSSTSLANPARHVDQCCCAFCLEVINCFANTGLFPLKRNSCQSRAERGKIDPDLSVNLAFLLIFRMFRYDTVSKHVWGVVMLRDLKPEDEASLVTITVAAAGAVPEEEEPPPPEPFEYHEE